eukprot:2366866-Prymnesium_polylepis.1
MCFGRSLDTHQHDRKRGVWTACRLRASACLWTTPADREARKTMLLSQGDDDNDDDEAAQELDEA